MSAESNLNRRDFLKTGAVAGTGLVLGFDLPSRPGLAEAAEAPFAPNAWIRVGTDNLVTIVVDRSEMGQGVQTSLPMLVAEELEADWSKIRIETAPADPKYNNPLFGFQGTGGSTSIRAAWTPLRKAGAAARDMLVTAAAQTWNVDKATCKADKGAVVHTPTGRRLTYGELAAKAATLPVPADVPLKDAKQFKIIGTRLARLDTPAKVDGSAQFGIDVRVPGMLTAVMARCPVFGGKVARFDATRAKAVRGVKDVVQATGGIAVVAETYWPALKGTKALDITWDEGPDAGNNTPSISKAFQDLAQKPGVVARKVGDADAALASAATKIEAAYESPFQAHAAMEPMNCTAHVRPDGCDIWAPTQFQTGTVQTVQAITGLQPGAIKVHTTFLGGGFGRRFEMDFIRDAVEISKTVNAPVKVVSPREDDIQHDFYRPASYSRLTAGLDTSGAPVAWTHTIVSPSIMSRVFPEAVQNGIDPSSVEGGQDLPYAIANLRVDYHLKDVGIPVGFWRSVGNSQNIFATESFIDEVAAAAKKDPYEFRRALLSDKPRHKAVLELAATKAGWGKPLPKGRARGIAVAESFGSFVAHVVEVSLDPEEGVRVHRVVAAVDCGSIVNPDTIEAQIQSAVVFGLTATLKSGITIDRGRVAQQNFDDYPMLRLAETPSVEVFIVPSAEAPGGIGEPGVPPLAPAVVNAVFALTGKRLRRLPVTPEDVRKA